MGTARANNALGLKNIFFEEGIGRYRVEFRVRRWVKGKDGKRRVKTIRRRKAFKKLSAAKTWRNQTAKELGL